MEKKKILRELIRDVHMPSFCDEEGYCEALDDCTAIDVGECSCCNINRIVRAFNRGIEFQKQKSNSSWISVEDDLPCNNPNNIHCGFTNTVLVIDEENNTYIAFMVKDKDNKWSWDSADNFAFLHSITHWMPIPKLPKE